MAGFGFDLTGRVALVTGASSGFGMRFGRILAESGAKVVLAARRTERLEALAAEIGPNAIAVTMDVADEASTIAAYDFAERAFGTVDTIVANAGVEDEARATDLAIDTFDRTIAVNLRGAFLTVREGSRRLIAAGSAEREHGRVVITSSITAVSNWAGTAAYSASKAGVLKMAQVLALEWARKGINVNVLLPGYAQTELVERWIDSEFGRKLLAGFPRQRLLQPSDLDAPLLFFASDASRGITGASLVIDDGQSL